MATDFQKRVLALARKVPKGKVSTYGELALGLGEPGAARAVGTALSTSPGMPKCPCHRIVRSNGQTGGFAFRPLEKIRLLRSEGVEVKDGRIVNLKKYLYRFS